jgi:flotillin
VATFKIGADEVSIRNAAERFLDAEEEEVDSIVKNVLEGSLRSIVGTLTVEELNLDRQKFQQAVQEAAKGDLATSGLEIDSFTIQAIGGEALAYMELVGQQELSRRDRDARMAKATADQEAAVREAEAQQIKLNAQRDVALREAEVQTLTAAAAARAAQAGPLADAEAQQEVVRKQTELAQLSAERTAKELLVSTVRPAEAEAEATVKRAEGEKQARIAQAQAEAERARLAGEAEAKVAFTKGEAAARVVSLTADADAHRTEVEGQAEALITFTKGEAEAKALALRADAYRQFNEAAVIQTVLSMMPEIVRAASEPIGKIQNLTVLSTDGASDVVRTTTQTLAQASSALKGLTGIDLPAVISNAMSGTNGEGSTTAARPPAPSSASRSSTSPARARTARSSTDGPSKAPSEGTPQSTVPSSSRAVLPQPRERASRQRTPTQSESGAGDTEASPEASA